MDIVSLPWKNIDATYDDLQPEDVVIVPAFGAPTSFMTKIEERGCYTVDTTCGDVMKVWRRVRGYAKEGITSIIHGKENHEETRATASRALGENGDGHYLVILTLADTDYVCEYIRGNGNKQEFLTRFKGSYSPSFDPDIHLRKIGVANQTTMLKSETQEIQNRLGQSRFRPRRISGKFLQVFEYHLRGHPRAPGRTLRDVENEDGLLLVVGGYNSSNTAHLVEIGEKELPTFFIRDASQITSLGLIVHYDLHHQKETHLRLRRNF